MYNKLLRKHMASKPATDPVYKEKRVPKGPIKFDKVSLTEEQRAVVSKIKENKITVLTGLPGSSKTFTACYVGLQMLLRKDVEKIVIIRPTLATENIGYLPGPQPLYSKILTPNGWTTMGEIHKGDFIVGKDGLPKEVIDIVNKHVDDVYELETTDGRRMRCTNNHLFLTLTFNDKKHGYKGSVKSLKEIQNSFLNKNSKLNHYLPFNDPVVFEHKEKSIPPYLLGVIIGDGCTSSSISFSSIDQEIVDRVAEDCDKIGIKVHKDEKTISYNLSSKAPNNKPGKSVIIKNNNTGNTNYYKNIGEALSKLDIKRPTLNSRCKANRTIDNISYSFGEIESESTNIIRDELIKMNLNYKLSYEKFIPKNYIFNSSIEDRLSLLRGLMDTDGTNDGNAAAFTTTSYQLALDIIELVQSLGGRAYCYIRDRIGRQSNVKNRVITAKRVSYEVTITLPYNPFHLSRKAKKYNPKFKHSIGIKSVTHVGKEEVQCITVDSEDHLYLTDNFIVTHNSLGEKMCGYVMPVISNMYDIYDKDKIDKYMADGLIEIIPLQFARGITFRNAFVIVEEAMNLTDHQTKTVLERFGKDSKMVITGDKKQTDFKNKSDSGFDKLLKIKANKFEVVLMTENFRDEIILELLKYYED